tara:strand:- start:2435 stop:3403 length:969 start_codon:yes stop_codon:yes gene_type:complete
MTKIKLLYLEEDYPNFTQGAIAHLVQQHFDLVQYQPGVNYNSADTVILTTFWRAKTPDTAWWRDFRQQGFRIIVDHLYDSDVDTGSSLIDPLMLELRCGNWLWYNSALTVTNFEYNQYQPQRNVQYSFLMLLNKIREHKDRVTQDLAPLLPHARWSYVERGRTFGDPGEANPRVIWHLYMNPEWYNTTAFSVVVESWMRSAVLLENASSSRTEVSEKIFKPIALYHPFVCYGSEGTCRYLQREGFETFSNLWSEDYDNILDDNRRFEATTAVVFDAVKNYSTGKFDAVTEQKLQHNKHHYFDTSIIHRRFKTEIIDVIQEFL